MVLTSELLLASNNQEGIGNGIAQGKHSRLLTSCHRLESGCSLQLRNFEFVGLPRLITSHIKKSFFSDLSVLKKVPRKRESLMIML